MGYMKNFAACQREYDNRIPEEQEEMECHECGGFMERNSRNDGYICEECGEEL